MQNLQDSKENIRCRWDPDNSAACFDDDACGCYIDPCEFFGVAAQDCMPMDESEVCCTVVETCCELER